MYKKFSSYIENKLDESIVDNYQEVKPQSTAAREAKKLHLTYIGFGRYTNKQGVITHVVENGQLKELTKPVFDYASKSVINDKQVPEKKLRKQEEEHYQKRDADLYQANKNFHKFSAEQYKRYRKIRTELKKFYDPEFYDDNEKQALEYYTGDGAEAINQHLYSGKYEQGPQGNEDDDLTQMVDDIDSAMENGPTTPFDFVSYTGLSMRYKKENIKPGQTYVFKGFVSSSINHEEALQFAGEGYNNSFGATSNPLKTSGIILELNIKKGQKGIYLKNLSGYQEEEEFLLPRETAIKIVSGPHYYGHTGIDPDVQDETVLAAIYKCEIVNTDK